MSDFDVLYAGSGRLGLALINTITRLIPYVYETKLR